MVKMGKRGWWGRVRGQQRCVPIKTGDRITELTVVVFGFFNSFVSAFVTAAN